MISPIGGAALAPSTDLRGRLQRLRFVFTDIDPVIDGATESEVQRAGARVVERLRARGVETVFVTRQPLDVAATVAARIGVTWVFAGVRDKAWRLPGVLASLGVSASEVAFVAQDADEVAVAQDVGEAGVVVVPSGAARAVVGLAHLVARASGRGDALEALDEALGRL